jgi:hypothetical protein
LVRSLTIPCKLHMHHSLAKPPDGVNIRRQGFQLQLHRTPKIIKSLCCSISIHSHHLMHLHVPTITNGISPRLSGDHRGYIRPGRPPIFHSSPKQPQANNKQPSSSSSKVKSICASPLPSLCSLEPSLRCPLPRLRLP